VCRLIDRHPSKRPKLDDLREARVNPLQPSEREIEREHRKPACGGDFIDVLERHPLRVIAAFRGAVPPRVIDQDAAHHLGGDPVEVRAASPVDIALFDEAQVCLVNECRRLQRVAGALVAKPARGDLAQFRVHEWQQAIERVPIALTPAVEQSADVVRRSHEVRETLKDQQDRGSMAESQAATPADWPILARNCAISS
jgi:hypothetical protein